MILKKRILLHMLWAVEIHDLKERTAEMMNIEEHNWIIDNCKPVHFSISKSPNRWKARLI